MEALNELYSKKNVSTHTHTHAHAYTHLSSQDYKGRVTITEVCLRVCVLPCVCAFTVRMVVMRWEGSA